MIVEISKERALELIEKVAVFFAARRMGTPAILFFESIRPLHFLGSQVMYFLAPFASIIFKHGEFEEFATLMSEHSNVELLIKRIDELDEQYNLEEREREKMKRQRFWRKITRIFKKKNKDEDGGNV
jgi:hypothetical protein